MLEASLEEGVAFYHGGTQSTTICCAKLGIDTGFCKKQVSPKDS